MDGREFLDSLGRCAGEPKKALQALVDYALMDGRRSLSVLSERYRASEHPPTRQLSRLKKWSAQFDWQSRVSDFDVAVYEATIEVWNRRREALRERDWTEGTYLRDLAADLIRTDQLIKSSVKVAAESAQAILTISQLQRLGAQEPTQIVRLTGAALDRIIERELEKSANSGEAAFSLPAIDQAES